MRFLSLFTALSLIGFCSIAKADEKTGVNKDGYVLRWLVLAPIAFPDTESGADALNKEQVKEEAKLSPKKGDKVKVGDKELSWKEHLSKDDVIDFNAILGAQTEDHVGYAVAMIEVEEEMKDVKMRTGSDDQCKVYLNGAEVLKVADARALEKDQDTTVVTLKKGINTVVVKVVNEKVDWSFTLRFLGKDDKPITKLIAK